MQDVDFEDLRSTGAFFTWQDKRENTILRKLDKAMINVRWLVEFSSYEARFLPPVTSDHSPCLVIILRDQERKHVPFKFFEFWTEHPTYNGLVRDSWASFVYGYPMFALYRKLGALKL